MSIISLVLKSTLLISRRKIVHQEGNAKTHLSSAGLKYEAKPIQTMSKLENNTVRDPRTEKSKSRPRTKELLRPKANHTFLSIDRN